MDFEQLYKALQLSFSQLEKRVEFLEHENAILIMEKKQWSAEKENQTLIIQNTLQEADEKLQQYAEEILRLKAFIKELRGE